VVQALKLSLVNYQWMLAALVLILLLEEIWVWKTLNLSQSHQVQFALFAEEMTLMSRVANRSATAQAAA
jgi:hypothetical protein